MRSFLSIFGLYLVAVAYGAIGPTANLYIQNKFIQPDGFNRSTVLAGGAENEVTFPGPLITGNKGDTFNLNVINELTDTSMLLSTSIHWHGFFQSGTAWADGPAGVTQCPIAPGHSFQYQFTAVDQAGTYWYHSHYSTQYCDGLRGAFVVYDPDDPYKSLYEVDDESTVITLADWYHTVAPVLGAAGASPPQSQATLINGLGRSSTNPTADLAIITVNPNTRYRFRLVSISCDPNFVFSIDGHLMTIIEVDGNNVQPLTVDSIQIFAGQRYSFILNANQPGPASNYWIRALPNIGSPGQFANGVNSAILRYTGAPDAEPTTPLVPSAQPMNEWELQTLEDPAAPGAPGPAGVDVPLWYNITLGSASHLFEVNNATFEPPSVPVLLQILSGARTAQELLPQGAVYPLPPNAVVEISIPGGRTAAPHPIHLHGHAFSVVRSAGNSSFNYDNPVRRDVVNSGSSVNDTVVIRFRTDNAGPWIMHCHIDWHLDKGLAIVMAEDADTAAGESHPASWDDLCPIFNALPAQTFN